MSTMNSHSRITIALSVMVPALVLLAAGCGDETAPPADVAPPWISGALVDATGCKSGAGESETAEQGGLDCLRWDWDGSDTLLVVHVNAALNCCPGTITGIVSAEDGVITIKESEGDDAVMCHCLCLYDLSWKISGIAGGSVSIAFIEKYLPEGATPLAALIDLEAQPSGSRCIERDSYPWTTGSGGSGPGGTVDGYTGCKELTGTGEPPSAFSPDSLCVVVYSHPSGGRLEILQVNTAYNCCVDSLGADFDITEGTITITGLEYPPGGLCDCICLYDVHYTINDIAPALYTIRFVDPYRPEGQEQLEIEVDASLEGSWSNCVHREGYPWGGESSEEEDQERLKALYDEIVEYIGTPRCSGGDDCRFIGVGSKPCGGPWRYLVYSASTLDEDHLRSLVEAHAAFEAYLNEKYGYVSTCNVPPEPVLECRDGICRAVEP